MRVRNSIYLRPLGIRHYLGIRNDWAGKFSRSRVSDLFSIPFPSIAFAARFADSIRRVALCLLSLVNQI